MKREELEIYHVVGSGINTGIVDSESTEVWPKEGTEILFKAEADTVMDELEMTLACYQTELEEARERVKELETIQPKWISVKDRLPEDDRFVLALTTDNTQYTAFYDDSIDDKDYKWFDGKMYLYNVTHWMPLPPPPKSDDLPTFGNHKSED